MEFLPRRQVEFDNHLANIKRYIIYLNTYEELHHKMIASWTTSAE